MADVVVQKRGFMFWALTPFLLIFVLAMPLLVPLNSAPAITILAGLELTGGLLLLGLYDPLRFWWAWRGVGAMVFLAYVWYVVAMLMEGKWQLPARRSESTLVNAIIGLIAIGLPGLWWALFGRFPGGFESMNSYSDEGMSEERPQS